MMEMLDVLGATSRPNEAQQHTVSIVDLGRRLGLEVNNKKTTSMAS
jgi:hypothetical protein